MLRLRKKKLLHSSARLPCADFFGDADGFASVVVAFNADLAPTDFSTSLLAGAAAAAAAGFSSPISLVDGGGDDDDDDSKICCN
jgi:hypothetical protein